MDHLEYKCRRVISCSSVSIDVFGPARYGLTSKLPIDALKIPVFKGNMLQPTSENKIPLSHLEFAGVLRLLRRTSERLSKRESDGLRSDRPNLKLWPPLSSAALQKGAVPKYALMGIVDGKKESNLEINFHTAPTKTPIFIKRRTHVVTPNVQKKMSRVFTTTVTAHINAHQACVTKLPINASRLPASKPD